MNRLPLTALRAFEAAASHMSFTTAAAALYVSPAAISQQIRALEASLGHPLFERLGASIRLTAEGTRLLPRVKRGFDELRRAMEEALQSQDTRQVNVSLLASFLQRWLLPRLPEFQAAHPDIDLRLSASTQVVDLGDSDFHAAIRFGTGRWPGVQSRRLLDDWLVPVCNPELLRRLGPITAFADLPRYTLLHANTEPWNDWVKPVFGRRHEVPVRSELDDSASAIIAAERGHGVAMARWSLVAGDVQAGRVVCAADWAVHHHRAYYFVTTAAKARLPAVQILAGWLFAAGAGFDPPLTKLRHKAAVRRT
ncbi:transcriptional regulator GcvA [Nevskia soli]|uniref:transcriptional regulator GcvA n=1 Tax=Nevskia soli TaxID=418856 RepID=UPI00068D7EF3|nr:transcriptional regulator GcvA [Nevskia soli]